MEPRRTIKNMTCELFWAKLGDQAKASIVLRHFTHPMTYREMGEEFEMTESGAHAVRDAALKRLGEMVAHEVLGEKFPGAASKRALSHA